VNDRKHVIVGLFVLGGFVLLGLLIIWFEGVSHVIRGGYTVRAHLPNAQGVRVGKRVHMDGIEIGDVTDITSSQPDRAGVWLHMRINPEVRVPKNAEFVAQRSMTGDIYLDFQTARQTSEALADDGSATVEGAVKAPTLVPEDIMAVFRDAMEKFERLDAILANIHELTEPRTLQEVEAGKRRNLWTTLAQFEMTAKTVQDQLEKPDSRFSRLLDEAATAAGDLRDTLKAARATLEKADKAIESVDATGKTFTDAGKKAEALLAKGDALLAKLTKTAEGADALLANLNGAVTDARQGKGTLGQLMTDDELHRALVTLVENLKDMTDNADRLLTLWRKEGILSKEGN
jgi:phospholipid/cholesterol/gamma-HCH transport system substrate-binding protein